MHPLCAVQPQYEFDDMGVGNVVARMDFRAAAVEGRLPGSVGSILRLDGFSMLVAWLDGSQSTVPVEEVRTPKFSCTMSCTLHVLSD